MHSTKRPGVAVAMAMTALITAGCGNSSAAPQPSSAGTVIPSSWYVTVDEQFKNAGDPSTVPTIDLDADCALDADVRVTGHSLRGFGAGASSVADTGRRYECDFDDPAAHLTVGKFTADADYAEVTDSLQAASQPGNNQTESTFTLTGRSIRVVRTVYPTNATHIDYEASVVDPANKGYALLSVETIGDLKATYSPRQAAQDFSVILGG